MLQIAWEWILCNAPWLFSGIGIAIIGLFFGRKKFVQKRTNIKNKISINGNKDSLTSFESANFGIITNEVRGDGDKKID